MYVFPDNDNEDSQKMLRHLELIDDEAAEYEVKIVKIDDPLMAKKYGHRDPPGLGFFRKGILELFLPETFFFLYRKVLLLNKFNLKKMFVLYSYLFTAETGNLYIKLAKTPLIYCNYFGDFVHQNVPKWLGDISRTFFCIELSFFSNAPKNFTHGQFFSFATK